MTSAPDALLPDADVEARIPAEGDGDERGPVPAVAGKGRVLLIEDDPAFNDVTRDYLVECGYTVVAVQSGAEGIREVLAGDFSLIFCDMAMPKMPGDMFYRAIERIRPQLCGRFVFMTGYRDDERTGEFIKQVGAYVLRKPFPLKHLVDSIAFIEVLSGFESVFEGGATTPVQPRVSAPADPYLANAMLFRAPPGEAEKLDAPHAPTPIPATPPAPAPRRPALSVPTPARRGGGFSSAFAWAGLASLLLAGIFGVRNLEARDRAAAALAELHTGEAEWAVISAQLEEAKALRPKLEAALGQPARILADRDRPRWTSALGGIVMAAGERIELHQIRARAVPEEPGACEVFVHGAVGGSQPRRAADHFREAVEEGLQKNATGRPVSVRFGQLEDEPAAPGAQPEQRRAAFVIIAKVGAAKNGEGR